MIDNRPTSDTSQRGPLSAGFVGSVQDWITRLESTDAVLARFWRVSVAHMDDGQLARCETLLSKADRTPREELELVVLAWKVHPENPTLQMLEDVDG